MVIGRMFAWWATHDPQILFDFGNTQKFWLPGGSKLTVFGSNRSLETVKWTFFNSGMDFYVFGQKMVIFNVLPGGWLPGACSRGELPTTLKLDLSSAIPLKITPFMVQITEKSLLVKTFLKFYVRKCGTWWSEFGKNYLFRKTSQCSEDHRVKSGFQGLPAPDRPGKTEEETVNLTDPVSRCNPDRDRRDCHCDYRSMFSSR